MFFLSLSCICVKSLTTHDLILNTCHSSAQISRFVHSDTTHCSQRKADVQQLFQFLVYFITYNLDHKHACTGVFLDLAKAFDTVPRKILNEKVSLFSTWWWP